MAFALISPIMIPISLTAWAAGLIMLAAATPDQPRPGSLMDGEPTHRGADSEAGSAPDGLPVALASLRRKGPDTLGGARTRPQMPREVHAPARDRDMTEHPAASARGEASDRFALALAVLVGAIGWIGVTWIGAQLLARTRRAPAMTCACCSMRRDGSPEASRSTRPFPPG